MVTKRLIAFAFWLLTADSQQVHRPNPGRDLDHWSATDLAAWMCLLWTVVCRRNLAIV